MIIVSEIFLRISSVRLSRPGIPAICVGDPQSACHSRSPSEPDRFQVQRLTPEFVDDGAEALPEYGFDDGV